MLTGNAVEASPCGGVGHHVLSVLHVVNVDGRSRDRHRVANRSEGHAPRARITAADDMKGKQTEEE